MNIILLFLFGELIFWASVLICFLMDKFLPDNFISKYKLHKLNKDNSNTIDRLSFMKGYSLKTFGLVILNHIVSIPLFYLINLYYNKFFSDPLPHFIYIYFQFLIMILYSDILFHITHYLLHRKLLYKYIHKIHHKFKQPIGISSHYVHPIEFLLLLIPVLSAPVILKIHPLIFYIWIFVIIINNVFSHSGYMTKYHYLHHKKNYVNYGSNPLFDKFCGTFEK
jgi:Sterol desaturase